MISTVATHATPNAFDHAQAVDCESALNCRNCAQPGCDSWGLRNAFSVNDLSKLSQLSQLSQLPPVEDFRTFFSIGNAPMRSVLARFIDLQAPVTVATPATVATVEPRPIETCALCEGLDPADRALADAYLDAIGETDPELRAEYLANLARNPRFIPQMRAAAVAAGVARWPS